jgi:sec-independent protein translocase protein TatC
MTGKDLRLPIFEHLEEIRKRVFVVLIVFVIFSTAGFYFREGLLQWLKLPGGRYLGALSVFSPTSAVLTFFKMAFFFGLIFSLPVLLYEIWMFIRPAVAGHLAWCGAFLIFSGTGLFITGALLSFYFLIPASLKFLLSIGREELRFLISFDSYISFVLLFMLTGGAIFELPLLAFFLAKLNILRARTMVRHWKTAVVGSVVLSAFVTPTPDVFNMALMATPIFVLYMVSLGVVMLTQPKDERAL